jgi:DNA-binding Xre family transcriptional regulator
MYAKGRRRYIASFSKLTAEKARQIKFSTESRAEISRKFGVSLATIHQIKSGKSWSHI